MISPLPGSESHFTPSNMTTASHDMPHMIAPAPSGHDTGSLSSPRDDTMVVDTVTPQPSDPNTKPLVTSSFCQRSMSMLEMKELADIRDFDNAMSGVTLSHDESKSNHGEGMLLVELEEEEDDDEEESFFFFDDGGETFENKRMKTSSSNYNSSEMKDESIPKVLTGMSGGGGMMRRSQSLASIPSYPSLQGGSTLLLSVQIHPIKEESVERDSSDDSSSEKGDPDELAKAASAVRLPRDQQLVSPDSKTRRPVMVEESPVQPAMQPKKSALKRASSMIEMSTTARDSPAERPNLKRNVSFSQLEIREYNVTLGDNPCCSSGPPVSLDWDYVAKPTIELDEYETTRAPRRTRRQMVLSKSVRQYLLLREYGFSPCDLRAAADAAYEIKRQRRATKSQTLALARFEEAWESAGRRMKQLVKPV